MDNEFHTVRGYQLLRQKNMTLTPAMEDYLEMVFRSSEEQGYLRLNELAESLNVRASSASKMVQKLGEYGLIKYKKYGIIELTGTGKELGAYLLTRHNIIEKFLSTIGIEENLLKETELIEHNISANTQKHMEIFNRFFESYPEFSKQLRAFVNARLDK